MAEDVSFPIEEHLDKSESDLQYYADNFDHLCRLCLSNERLVTIYSNIQDRNVYYIRHFVKIALDLLAIQINKHDILPKLLCESCEKNLNIIANFKRKCDESSRVLQRIADNGMINPKPRDHGIIPNDCERLRARKRRGTTSAKQSKQAYEQILKKLPQGINVGKLSKTSIENAITNHDRLEDAKNLETEFCPKTVELIMVGGENDDHQGNGLMETKEPEDLLLETPFVEDQTAPEDDWDVEESYSDRERERPLPSEGVEIEEHREEVVEAEIRRNKTEAEEPPTVRRPVQNHTDGQSCPKLPKEKTMCSVCGAMVNNIKSHMAIHSGRSHQCEQCPKSFTSRNKLQSHINGVHLRKRDFKCDICGKAFLEKNNLKGHMRIHSGERKYTCDLCPKTFLFAGTLRCHKLTHTQEKRQECAICGKLFLLRTTLNKHLRVHTGEKPHNCTLCDKGFRTSTHLVVHMRTHTGEKPLNCRICGMAFAHHKARSVHMKTKHAEELVALGLIDDRGHLKF